VYRAKDIRRFFQPIAADAEKKLCVGAENNKKGNNAKDNLIIHIIQFLLIKIKKRKIPIYLITGSK
jgi:hypothetical protein